MSETRGEIVLHDKHAIGLIPYVRPIGLYPSGTGGRMIGVRMNVDLRHYRKAGASGGFMTLEWLELHVPGNFGHYTGRLEGWEKYKESGYTSYYKPKKCLLIPHEGEYITFDFLDYYNEKDPFFYFGWGLRSDNMPPAGYRRRATVAYMGVNYPVTDGLAPSWTDVPSQAETFSLLKPSTPPGTWHVKGLISPFQVDSEVAQQTHIHLHVREGWSPFRKGELDFVHPAHRAVGKSGVDWSSIKWGNMDNWGELSILSGTAAGRKFRITGSMFTGKNPPSGYPKNTWIFFTHPSEPVPAYVGVNAGDSFLAKAPFIFNCVNLVYFVRVLGPGSYPEQDLSFTFNPI